MQLFFARLLLTFLRVYSFSSVVFRGVIKVVSTPAACDTACVEVIPKVLTVHLQTLSFLQEESTMMTRTGRTIKFFMGLFLWLNYSLKLKGDLSVALEKIF